MKSLNQVPKDEPVFVDSNIFLYATLKHPIHEKTCEKFLDQLDQKNRRAFTTTTVLGEVFHVALRKEIAKREKIPIHSVTASIKKEKDFIERSFHAFQIIEDIRSIQGLTLLGTGAGIFTQALKYSRQYNLLIKDAQQVATAEIFRVSNFATNDNDFKRVPFLKVYQP